VRELDALAEVGRGNVRVADDAVALPGANEPREGVDLGSETVRDDERLRLGAFSRRPATMPATQAVATKPSTARTMKMTSTAVMVIRF